MAPKESAGPQAIRAEWQDISQLLKKAYGKKKRLNKGFSLGVVARRLDLSVPFLSQLLNAKRALPVSMVEPICAALDLDAEKRDFLYRRLLKKKEKSPLTQLIAPATAPASSSADWNFAAPSSFWVLEEWFYLPLLNCTLLPAYDGKATTLATLLGLPLAQVENAIARLRAEGLLELKEGMLRKAQRLNDFHSAATKEQIRAYHRDGLHRAEAELTERTEPEHTEELLITTLSFTVADEHVGWAKQRLADFLRQLTEELTEAPGQAVYQLGVQFFPVTRKKLAPRPRD
jgi:uncharacterized protein (TIGR02147 family)